MGDLASRNGFSQPVQWAGNLSAESSPPTACKSTVDSTSSSSSIPAAASSGTVPESASFDSQCVLGFDTIADMRQWLLHNPGRAGIAIAFGGSPGSDAGYAGEGYWNNASFDPLADRSQLLYELWHNSSTEWSYQRAGLDPLKEGLASAELQGVRALPGQARSLRHSCWHPNRSSPDGFLTHPSPPALRNAPQRASALLVVAQHHLGPSYLLSTQRMVDDALLASHAPPTSRSAGGISAGAASGSSNASHSASGVSLSVLSYPRLRENESSGIGAFVILFVAIALLISHVLMVNRIVSERERGVTGAMRAMGLLDTAFWASYWALALPSSLLTCAIVYAAGAASDFYLFQTVDGGVLYTIFLLFSLAMAGGAFVIGSVISRTRTAVLLSVFGLISGLQLISSSVTAPMIGYIFWEKPFPSWIRSTLELTLPGVSLMKVTRSSAPGEPLRVRSRRGRGRFGRRRFGRGRFGRRRFGRRRFCRTVCSQPCLSVRLAQPLLKPPSWRSPHAPPASPPPPAQLRHQGRHTRRARAQSHHQ